MGNELAPGPDGSDGDIDDDDDDDDDDGGDPKLDSIADSVFVKIGGVGQIQYQNKRSQ